MHCVHAIGTSLQNQSGRKSPGETGSGPGERVLGQTSRSCHRRSCDSIPVLDAVEQELNFIRV